MIKVEANKEEDYGSVKVPLVERYRVSYEDNTVTATRTKEWQNELKKATDSLCRDILAGEEKFIISEFETEALEKLRDIIKEELARRLAEGKK